MAHFTKLGSAILAGLAVAALLVGGASGASGATPKVSNPVANIAESPSYPSAICQPTPSAKACQDAAIAALNHARAVLGLRPYALPAGFEAMSAANQLLTLSNLDRAVYGLKLISGLSTPVSAAAQVGIRADADPAGLLGHVGGVYYTSWTANWAAGWSSPLFIYYEWMYNDGPGSANIDCTATNARGCWDHRANVLASFAGAARVVMGVGTGLSPTHHAVAFTELYEGIN